MPYRARITFVTTPHHLFALPDGSGHAVARNISYRVSRRGSSIAWRHDGPDYATYLAVVVFSHPAAYNFEPIWKGLKTLETLPEPPPPPLYLSQEKADSFFCGQILIALELDHSKHCSTSESKSI